MYCNPERHCNMVQWIMGWPKYLSLHIQILCEVLNTDRIWKKKKKKNLLI